MLRKPAPILAPVPGCSSLLCAISGCMEGAVCGPGAGGGGPLGGGGTTTPGGGGGTGPGGGGGIGRIDGAPDGGMQGEIGGGGGCVGGACARADAGPSTPLPIMAAISARQSHLRVSISPPPALRMRPL